jgi:hypothetical protein
MKFADWRDRARKLLAAEVPPHLATWTPSLFEPALPDAASTRVPASFVRLAEDAILHREPSEALQSPAVMS